MRPLLCSVPSVCDCRHILRRKLCIGAALSIVGVLSDCAVCATCSKCHALTESHRAALCMCVMRIRAVPLVYVSSAGAQCIRCRQFSVRALLAVSDRIAFASRRTKCDCYWLLRIGQMHIREARWLYSCATYLVLLSLHALAYSCWCWALRTAWRRPHLIHVSNMGSRRLVRLLRMSYATVGHH